MKKKWIGKMIAFGIVACIVIGFVMMNLWNWLVPELFHGPTISFWQAIGLLVLSKILFGSFGRRGHGFGRNFSPEWRERWASMTPEDRERLKQKMRDKWCHREDSIKTDTTNG